LVADLLPLAQALAAPDTEITLALSSLLSRAINRYQLFIQPYLEAVADAEAENLGRDLQQFQQAAQINGWVSAGAYYWTIARLNERAASLMYSTATWSEGEPSLDGEVLQDFEVVFERLNRYLKGAFRPERASSAEHPPAEFPSFAWFSDKLSGYLGRLSLSTLIAGFQTNDPVAVLAGLGRFLVVSGQAIIGLKIGSNALAAATGSSASSLLGQVLSVFTGSVSSFIAGATLGAVEAMGPYLLILSLTILGYGLFLAYFLPALPFLIWLGGVLTWVALIVEALAAAPLWVAAHALPEGEGFSGNAGRQGYFLFLGVLLRPPMMVLGFLLAMTLMGAVGQMAGHIFSVFGFGRLGESFLGLAGFLAFAVILGLAVVAAAWKLFGLAIQLPDKVLSWIGQHMERFGEVHEAHSQQGSFTTAGGVGRRFIEPLIKPTSKTKIP
jgi:conjugal transfer/type IV secretion protein DotA/TraY